MSSDIRTSGDARVILVNVGDFCARDIELHSHISSEASTAGSTRVARRSK
jgi:hypothetical protein